MKTNHNIKAACVYLLLGIVLTGSALLAEPPAPATPIMKNDNVSSLVHSLTSEDRLSALAALDRLNATKDFDLIAANLAKISPRAKNAAIDILIEADTSSPLVVTSLLHELTHINQAEPPLSGGENLAILRMSKKKLATGISRKTKIAISDGAFDSKEALSQFILEVEKYLQRPRE